MKIAEQPQQSWQWLVARAKLVFLLRNKNYKQKFSGNYYTRNKYADGNDNKIKDVIVKLCRER